MALRDTALSNNEEPPATAGGSDLYGIVANLENRGGLRQTRNMKQLLLALILTSSCGAALPVQQSPKEGGQKTAAASPAETTMKRSGYFVPFT